MGTYTLVVTNYGSTVANNVVITDTVPTYTTLDAASLSSDARYTGLEPGSIITWTPEIALTPGKFLTRTFAVTVDLGVGNQTAIVNSAHLASGSRIDSSSATAIVAAPDLNATIDPNPAPIEPTTSAITYTITINNNGSIDATTVRIINTIPGSTDYLTDSASNGGYETAPGSGVLAWSTTTIEAGSAISRTFKVTVNETLQDGDELINLLSVNTAQSIKIENFKQAEFVGVQRVYLPIILKKTNH